MATYTGATGVQGRQGLQGPYGPRGPTGLLGWTQQPYMNQYKTNPPGPVGPIGLLVVTGSYSSGTVTLTNATAGTIYQVTGSLTIANSSPTTGAFWIIQNTSASSVTITYPTTIGVSSTVSIPAGNFVAFYASSGTNFVPF